MYIYIYLLYTYFIFLVFLLSGFMTSSLVYHCFNRISMVLGRIQISMAWTVVSRGSGAETKRAPLEGPGPDGICLARHLGSAGSRRKMSIIFDKVLMVAAVLCAFYALHALTSGLRASDLCPDAWHRVVLAASQGQFGCTVTWRTVPLAHLRWSPYSLNAPLSWLWDFTLVTH